MDNCLNYFRVRYTMVDYSFPQASIIEESPLKIVIAREVGNGIAKIYNEANLIATFENHYKGIVSIEVIKVVQVVPSFAEIDDDELNQACDKLLIQEFNPNAKDFEDDQEDVLDDAKRGKSNSALFFNIFFVFILLCSL